MGFEQKTHCFAKYFNLVPDQKDFSRWCGDLGHNDLREPRRRSHRGWAHCIH